MKALTILGVMASLAVSGVAQAAPPPPQPICQGGILRDALTGRPVLDPRREPIPCGAPEAGLGLDPMYALAGLVGLGAGIGIGAGIWSGGGDTKYIPVPVSVSP